MYTRITCRLPIKRSLGYSHVSQWGRQKGITLVELMVGVAIGLMVVAVAGGALMVSRSTSGTISDVSALQQQAGYAFRVIGQQLRQAGSLYLNLNSTNNHSPDVDSRLTPVGIEAKATSSNGKETFSPVTDSLGGTDTTLRAGYRGYQMPIYSLDGTSINQILSRDCLGGPQNSDVAVRISSTFALSGNKLVCTGSASLDPQTLLGNVANFRIRYLRMTGNATGNPAIEYVNAATAKDHWSQITGVEVCLVLYGTETMNLTSATYTDCDGTTSVDYTNATSTDMSGNAIGAGRAQRLHKVFRSVYQVRSQGLIGNVL